MAQEYKISAVSTQRPPREWSFEKDGSTVSMKTYAVKFEGDDIVVELNKQASSQPPKAGDTVYGDIRQDEYGYKFKAAKQFNKVPQLQRRDDSAIQAQWAIGQATSLSVAQGIYDTDKIERTAKEFFAMIQRVKDNKPLEQKVAAVMNDSLPNDEDLDKPIDLSQIPF